ncbi:MAG: hypothetical protein OEW67_06950 [Cyclobacteriaceae bacterium]|nr:hypothetical protein [Cyclobacteriaceae bacterium]
MSKKDKEKTNKSIAKSLKKQWGKAKELVGKTFKTKKYLLKQLAEEKKRLAEEQKKVEEMAYAQRTPGLTCPQCSYRMDISIAMLLAGEPIVCTACGLSLTVEKEKSEACLTELKKVNEAIENVEVIKNNTQL